MLLLLAIIIFPPKIKRGGEERRLKLEVISLNRTKQYFRPDKVQHSPGKHRNMCRTNEVTTDHFIIRCCDRLHNAYMQWMKHDAKQGVSTVHDEGTHTHTQ